MHRNANLVYPTAYISMNECIYVLYTIYVCTYEYAKWQSSFNECALKAVDEIRNKKWWDRLTVAFGWRPILVPQKVGIVRSWWGGYLHTHHPCAHGAQLGAIIAEAIQVRVSHGVLQLDSVDVCIIGI